MAINKSLFVTTSEDSWKHSVEKLDFNDTSSNNLISLYSIILNVQSTVLHIAKQIS